MGDNENKMSRKTELMFQIGLTIFSIAAFLLFQWQGDIEYLPKYSHYFFLFIGVIFFLSIFKKYKIVDILITILMVIPSTLTFFLAPLIEILTSLIFTILSVIFLVTGLVLLLPNKLDYELGAQLQLYLVISIASITMVTFGDRLIKFWNHIHKSPWKKTDYSNYALRILGQNTVKYLLYFIFFIALVVLNSLYFYNSEGFEILKFKNAIIQSFITYLAYERLHSNRYLLINRKGVNNG